MKLTSDILHSLQVPTPSYDLNVSENVMVHFGVGAFHRAHQAAYLDELKNAENAPWTIWGAGLLPSDMRTAESFEKQEGLYTLVTSSSEHDYSARIIGSISKFIYAPENPAALKEALLDPRVKIVSLTITEGGYSIANPELDMASQNELTRYDLENWGNVDHPRSVWGYLVASLLARKEAGQAPFTVMSCDNIIHNGEVTRDALIAFASRVEPDLVNWIENEMSFPSSMVDRITPVPSKATAEELAQKYGYEDEWPVYSEGFIQWVLEDNFSQGRPQFEKSGVQLVEDVTPFEHMKLRLLNASHQVMSHLGLLAGFEWVHDVCHDPLFEKFLRRYMDTEARPTLAPVPGVDLDVYRDQLITRFQNVAIKDTLERQIVDSSERIPKFVLPVLRDQLSQDGPIEICTLTIAAWATRLEKLLDSDLDRADLVDLRDSRQEQLVEAIRAESETPGSFIEIKDIFGDLRDSSRFMSMYVQYRERLRTESPTAIIRDLLESGL